MAVAINTSTYKKMNTGSEGGRFTWPHLSVAGYEIHNMKDGQYVYVCPKINGVSAAAGNIRNGGQASYTITSTAGNVVFIDVHFREITYKKYAYDKDLKLTEEILDVKGVRVIKDIKIGFGLSTSTTVYQDDVLAEKAYYNHFNVNNDTSGEWFADTVADSVTRIYVYGFTCMTQSTASAYGWILPVLDISFFGWSEAQEIGTNNVAFYGTQDINHLIVYVRSQGTLSGQLTAGVMTESLFKSLCDLCRESSDENYKSMSMPLSESSYYYDKTAVKTYYQSSNFIVEFSSPPETSNDGAKSQSGMAAIWESAATLTETLKTATQKISQMEKIIENLQSGLSIDSDYSVC